MKNLPYVRYLRRFTWMVCCLLGWSNFLLTQDTVFCTCETIRFRIRGTGISEDTWARFEQPLGQPSPVSGERSFTFSAKEIEVVLQEAPSQVIATIQSWDQVNRFTTSPAGDKTCYHHPFFKTGTKGFFNLWVYDSDPKNCWEDSLAAIPGDEMGYGFGAFAKMKVLNPDAGSASYTYKAKVICQASNPETEGYDEKGNPYHNLCPTTVFECPVRITWKWGKSPEKPGEDQVYTPAVPWTQDHPVVLDILSMGKTTGDIGLLTAYNPTGEIQRLTFGPAILSAPNWQAQITSQQIPLQLDPGETVTLPVSGGICIDNTVPVAPAGTPFTVLTQAETGPALNPGSDFGTFPGFIPAQIDTGRMSVVPKIPGYEHPFAYTVNLRENLTDAAPLLFEAAKAVNETVDGKMKAGAFNLPIKDPAAVESTVEQHAFWLATSAMTGNEYKKIDFQQNLEKDFEKKMGQPISTSPPAVRKDFYDGMDALWHAFNEVATDAKLINPAANWQGLKAIRSVNIGPNGGTISLPGELATLIVPPGTCAQPTQFTLSAFEYPGLTRPVVQLHADPATPALAGNTAWLTMAGSPADQIFREKVSDEPIGTLEGDTTLLPGRFYPVDPPTHTNRGTPVMPSDLAQGRFLVSGQQPEACPVDAAKLIPPSPPAGYRYVGRIVTVNFRIHDKLTTYNGEIDPEKHLVHVSSSTRVTDYAVDCDVIVTHVYERTDLDKCEPEIPEELLKQPPAPKGTIYVGRVVTANGYTDEEKTTLPLGYEADPDKQIVHIASRTLIEDHTCVSDVIVAHYFEKIDQEGKECPVPAEMLIPPPSPDPARMGYAGRTVVINHQTDPDLTSVRPDRLSRPTDQVILQCMTYTVEGKVCEVIVSHTYVMLEELAGENDHN